jgi:CRISPR/Cas system-associated protein Cas10 (large subunit of type III CRISPR-Cas system)
MSIRLSKEHGVNPSISVCPICGKDTGLILFGRLKGDEKAPMTVKGDLCDECKEKYVRIIEVESSDNRKATGRYSFVPKEALNVECPKGEAIMGKDEFTKLFG